MTNAIYPKWKEAIVQGSANSSLTGTVKVALVDLDIYTYSSTDQFYTAISTAVVGTPLTLASKTYTGGVFDAADITYPLVSGATVEALIGYIDTGVAGTSRLVFYLDTSQNGIPITPAGFNIGISFNASGIFAL